MTEQNRGHAIAEEIRRAGDALRAADLLGDNGLFSDAVSRLYYCVLSHVRALLLTLDVETRSHEAALRLLSLHFVKAGTLPRKLRCRVFRTVERAGWISRHAVGARAHCGEPGQGHRTADQ